MLTLAAVLFLCSCGFGSDPASRENSEVIRKVRASYLHWLDKKQKFNNVYSVTYRQSSSENTHMRTWLSTLFVEDNKVTCRYFLSIDDLAVSLWLESLKMSTLGKHAEGAPLKTMEELYQACILMALTDTQKKIIYTEDDVGILRSCYFPNNNGYPNYSDIKISGIDGSSCALKASMR